MPPRPCPVCCAAEPHSLFQQHFAEFSEGGLLAGYLLTICGRCGAAYADQIPDQGDFDRYYAEMSKYEPTGESAGASPIEAERYRQIADLLAPHLAARESILDLGCATGALLAEFKRRGFARLLGMDPSRACASAGRRFYDIPIRALPIARLGEIGATFDVVLLIGVLEHLCDLEASLGLVSSALQADGRVYVEVPDATRYDRWFSAPYQFLSMEHINYFSPQSLTNLMARRGFQREFVRRVPRFLGPTAGEPTLAGLFRKGGVPPGGGPLPFDSDSEPALRRYIEASTRLDQRIGKLIDELVQRQTPLLVWGAGTHTLRLLKSSSLGQANLVAFIDSNRSYQGKRLLGIPILAPDQVVDRGATLLISSHVSEQAIKDQVVKFLQWPNPLICLYEDSPTELSP